MTIEQRIAQLERQKCCCAAKYHPTFEDFPIEGKDNNLYVDESTGNIYIWDGDSYITADTATVSTESKINLNTELPLLTPLDTNNPATAEVQAWSTANLTGTDLTDGTQLIYNAPSGGDAANPDYTWTVNNGVVTLSNKRVFNTKTVYVDAGSGSDVTGKRGYREFPFKTLNAGINAALESDLLFVFPGNYIQSTPITTWINIYCESGVDWLLQSNFINTTDFALAKIVDWKFDILRQVTYEQYSTRPLNTLGGYNLTINTAEKVFFFSATKNRSVKVNKSINSAFGIQSIGATDAQGTNEIENAEWDYTQGVVSSLFNSQNSNNAQISFYCKNLKSVNSVAGSTSTIGYFFGSDVGTSKHINTTVYNVRHDDPNIYVSPAGVLAGSIAWRGTTAGTHNGLLLTLGAGIKSNSIINVDLKNVTANGHVAFLSLGAVDKINVTINMSGSIIKGIPLWTSSLHSITNSTIIFNFDIIVDSAMGLFLGFFDNTNASNNIQASNTIIVTGRIKTKQSGYPCISIGQGSAPSNNTNGTILLKNLTLINDGTVSPIMCAVSENVQIQNVVTNSLVTDPNITEVGQLIVRNINYK
jgi:hypothetical protein